MNKVQELLKLSEAGLKVVAKYSGSNEFDDLADRTAFIVKHVKAGNSIAYYADDGSAEDYVIAFKGSGNAGEILRAAKLSNKDNADMDIQSSKRGDILYIESQ